MAKKKIIKFEDDFEGILYGLVSQLKDYRLCWYLNKELNFDLMRMNDIEIIHKKKNKTAVFSLYRYEDDLDKCLVYVISNKYQGEHFLAEVRHADFFLVVKGEVDEEKKVSMQSALKNIPAIQLVIPLEYSGLKSKENFVFE